MSFRTRYEEKSYTSCIQPCKFASMTYRISPHANTQALPGSLEMTFFLLLVRFQKMCIYSSSMGGGGRRVIIERVTKRLI
jgi:hypothetical protein